MITIKKMSGIKVLGRLINYTWHASPATFMILVITSLLTGSLSFLEVVTVEMLFDSAVTVSNGAPAELLCTPILLLLAVLAFNHIAEWLEYLASGYFWRRGSGYMKALHHMRISRMNPVEFEDPRNMDELQKAKLGSEDAPAGLRVIIQVLFLYLPYILLLLAYLASVKPMLVLTVLLIFVPTLLIEYIRMNQNYSFENHIANRRRKTQYFESCMTSKEYFKETLLNGAFPFFQRLFINSSKEFSKEYTSLKKRMLKTTMLLRLLHAAGYLGMLALLVYYVFAGSLSIGLFAAIYYSISKITSIFKQAIDDIGEAMAGISNTSFLVRLLDDGNVSSSNSAYSKACDIHLKKVCFTYPNSQKETLINVDLTIKAGTSLAIVGENGSGKSTLTKLILGIYDPTKGAVEYGNEPISQYDPVSRFERCSAVFQNFIKYKLSVEDNITISDIDSQAPIDDVLAKADIDLVQWMLRPDTILSREFCGQELSGGEWQRIAIARGLYRPNDLIVLDEPTAAIDPIEEANVFHTFQRISTGKTCIFVTHRLGSAQIADRIIVMEKGMVAEDGTHKELMEQRGLYYHLFQSQAQWYVR